MEWWLLLVLILVKFSCTGASFIVTPMETEICGGTNANLSWVFSNAAFQATVQWTVDGTTVARLLGGTSFLPGTGYAGRVQNDGNGGLIITSVTSADSGKYKCVVSYSDATPLAENEITLNVYNAINTPLQITEVKSGSSATLSSNLTDSSITYTWTTPNGNALGTPITVNSNGNYTLCISGGRAQCLNPSLSSCVSYEVSGVVSPPTPDECPLFQYAFWPCFCIVLVGTLLVIAVSYCVGKDSKLQESSLKKSCGCCPSDNTCCMAVCPLCTDALCTGSKKTGLSTTAKNVISVVVFLIVAAVIGVIIAFGLGVDSGKCILALILSIVCGLVLVEIFTVSVYPHWPCLPEKGNGGLYNLCGR